MPMGVSQHFCCQCPYPQSEPQLLHTSTGDPPTLAGRLGSVSYRITTLFPQISMHTRLCVCPPRVCFPQSQRSPEIRFHQPSKSDFLVSLVPLVYLQAGKHELGLRTFTTVGKILWFKCFPVCGLTTWLVWDLTLSRLHPSYHIIVVSFVFHVGCLLGWVQVSSHQWLFNCCDFGAFTGVKHMSFTSAILFIRTFNL